MWPSRMVGEGERRARSSARTVGAARGSTSMGMVGHLVRRRGWSLRWSGLGREGEG